MSNLNIPKVLIIDFGAQYTQLIARRVRELKVYSEIVRHDIKLEDLKKLNPAALILTGGPGDVDSKFRPKFDEQILRLGIPTLGLCYGFQLIAKSFGGETKKLGKGEYGLTEIHNSKRSEILNPGKQIVWMSHGVSVIKAPKNFLVTSKSELVSIEAIENRRQKIFGVQFHPEVKHTQKGIEIFKKFLFDVVGLKPIWNSKNIIKKEVEQIKSQVSPDEIVVCALSGGVDSAVAATLVYQAIGKQLICVFVDHGLLRSGEKEQVENDFAKALNIPLITVDAKKEFLTALKNVEEPEKKRKIIGEKFIRTFEKTIKTKIEPKFKKNVTYLVQGTLYPDIVESGSLSGGVGANIKSHHNVGGLPKDMKLKLIEPLRDLFKDEVRKIGKTLGVPPTIIQRQPFPGPGLAIRIIGEVNESNLKILQNADLIARNILTEANLDHLIWQCPIVLLAKVRSVGVQGDGRTYGHPIVIRPVESDDAMTADFYLPPKEVLSKIATQITNQIPEVNRVVLDITSKPPGTIEWE